MLTESSLNVKPQSLIIKRASGIGTLQSVTDAIADMRKSYGNHVIQIFDPKAIVSRDHLLASYLNARVSFSEKSNRASSLSVEMLLFAAMTRQISAAIKTVGAKTNNDFVLFTDSKSAYGKLRKNLSRVSEFEPTAKESGAASRRLGIRAKGYESLDSVLLQKIALSKLERGLAGNDTMQK